MLGIAFVACLGVGSAGASLLDAFVLAVEHFDPDHEVGLQVESDEVKFLAQALEMARKAVPAVEGIHVPTDRAGRDKFRPTMFRTLKLVDPEMQPNLRTLTPELMAAIAGEIGTGCRVEVDTHEKNPGRPNAILRRSTLWSFDEYCRDGGDIEKCGNAEVVRWLCTRGIREVLLIENSYKGRDRAELYLRYGQIVDLEFESKKLRTDPLYQGLFGDYVLQPHLGGLIGEGKSVEVVADPWISGFEGVMIKFNLGWGDCPAGCIHWHHWIFAFRTEGEKEGERWPLVGGLVSEGGDPIR